MKEYYKEIEIDGQKYLMAFDLNVMEAVQDEFGSLKKISSIFGEANDEYNIKAIKFLFREMLNEGIEISNEKNGENKQPLTLKQVGRLLTSLGMSQSAVMLADTISEATKSEEKN